MSLISDALRKARQEAAEREAAARDGVVPPVVLEAGGRFGVGVVVGAAIALAALAVGAVLVWFALRPSPVVVVEAAPTAVIATVPATGAEEPTSTPEPPISAATPQPPSAAVAGPTPLPTATAAPSPTGTSIPAAAATAPPTPPPSQPLPSGTPATRVFVVDARLGDLTLTLDLLVHRTVDPWAEINGQEVRVGSMVEGFEVVAIDRDRVRLREAGGALVEIRVR